MCGGDEDSLFLFGMATLLADMILPEICFYKHIYRYKVLGTAGEAK
jgi:hypothetical protein